MYGCNDECDGTDEFCVSCFTCIGVTVEIPLQRRCKNIFYKDVSRDVGTKLLCKDISGDDCRIPLGRDTSRDDRRNLLCRDVSRDDHRIPFLRDRNRDNRKNLLHRDVSRDDCRITLRRDVGKDNSRCTTVGIPLQR